MAQYRDGTVTTAFESPATSTFTVTGTGTLWQEEGILPGDEILIGSDALFHVIDAVVSDTELTLASPYSAEVSDRSYVINRDFTTHYGFPKIQHGDLNAPEAITRALVEIDAALAPVGSVDLAGQTASIGATVLVASAEDALYRISYSAWVDGGAGGSGSMVLEFSGFGVAGSGTVTADTLTVSNPTSAEVAGSFVRRGTAGQGFGFTTTVTGSLATATYGLKIRVRKE